INWRNIRSEQTMAVLPDQASSDITRLIEAIRSLDQALRKRQPSAPKLIRRKTTLHNGVNTGPNMGDATETGGEFRPGQVTVEVRIVFLKIGEIDTQKEKYTADVFLHAKWREPKLDGQEHKSEDIDWDRQWTPKLYIDNVLGEPKESIWYVLCYDDDDRCTVYEKHRLSGSFSEFLELNQFPFDTQDLAITVTSERSVDEIDLVEDQNELCGVNVQSFKDEQEWRLHHHVETWTKSTTKDKYILITMSILCSVCAWHAILPIIIKSKDESTARYADTIVLIAMGSIFTGFHLIFILWVLIMVCWYIREKFLKPMYFLLFQNRMKRQTLGQKEEDHENRQRMLETITDGSKKDRNKSHSSSRITPYGGVVLNDMETLE
ncbi:hypothetical protein LSH36_148g00003, partial [Paralvinella palmiformis]